MLGSSVTQGFFASAHFIQLNSNVWAEWNYNSLIQPFAISTKPYNYSTGKISLPIYMGTNWDATNTQSIPRSSINYAKMVPYSDFIWGGDSSGSNVSMQISVPKNKLTTTASYQYSFNAGSYYKIVFFVNKDKESNYEVIQPITNLSITKQGGGSGTTYTYRVQPIGRYGQFIGLSNCPTATIQNYSSLGSGKYNQLSWKNSNGAGSYKIYREYDNKYKLIGTTARSPFRDTGQSKIDDDDDPIFTPDISITPIVQILDSSSNPVDSEYYVKISDISGGEPSNINSTVLVDGIEWKKIEVYFINKGTSGTKTINLSLNINSPIQNRSIYVTPLWIYPITEFDYFNNNLFPAESVFSARRPGEALLNPFLNSTKTNVNMYDESYVNGGNSNGRGVSYSFMSPQTIFDKPGFINIVPSTYNKYKYYVSESKDVLNNELMGISAFYDQYLNINKIIIKSNPAITTINSNSGSVVLYYNKTNGTSSSYYIAGPFNFDTNGISIFYYDDGTWKNKSGLEFSNLVAQSASANNTSGGGWLPPAIQNNGQLPTNSIFNNLTGICFVAATSLVSNGDDTDKRLHLVEISPRLEIDITNYVENYSLTKELDRSETNANFPIGYLSSNNGSIRVNNFPVIYNEKPLTIFEDRNVQSTFYDLLKQGVKFTGYFWGNPERKDFNEAIPAFSLYSDTWNVEDIDAVNVYLYDSLKHYSMSSEAPQYYAKGENLLAIITHLLELSGFSDYSMIELKHICEKKAGMSYFWTDENKSVFECLQEILIAYQIGAYINEVGFLKFTDLDDIISKKYNSAMDFYLSDSTTASWNNYPNIVESTYRETINPRIGKIIINYKIPNTQTSPTSKNNAIYEEKINMTDTRIKVFNEESKAGLCNTTLDKSMSISDNKFTSINFEKNPRLSTGGYSGTFFIGAEAVSAEGAIFTYQINGGKEIYPYLITKDYDTQNADSNFLSMNTNTSQNQIKRTFNYQFTGVKRGMYKTEIKPHNVYSDVSEYNADFNTTKNKGKFEIVNNALTLSTQSGLVYSATKEAIQYDYDHYSFTFKVSVNAASYVDAKNFAVGIFPEMSTDNPAIWLENNNDSGDYNNNTLLKFMDYSGKNKIGFKINSSDDEYIYSIKLPKNLFDGKKHRFSIWLDTFNYPYTIYYRIDDEEINKFKWVDSDNSNMYAPGFKSTSIGIFAGLNGKDSNQEVQATFYEIYACKWPRLNYDDTGYFDLKNNPKYHFQTNKFLNYMLNFNDQSQPYNSKYFLWQDHPRIIGFKHYQNEKLIAAPAVIENYNISFAGYDPSLSQDEIDKGGLLKIEQNELSYSDPLLSPFTLNQIVINNTKSINVGNTGPTLLMLNTENSKMAGGGGNEVDITPYEIEAEVLYFSTDKKTEKVVDSNSVGNSIQMRTDWIQNKSDADKIINKMSYLIPTFNSEISIDIFGNPLIETSDICGLWYKLKGIGFDKNGDVSTPPTYFVNSVRQEWDGSLKTSLVLRQL